MPEVSIHSAAETEYETAIAWYLARSKRAADGFETAFECALDSIAANPEVHPLCDDRHRFCLLRRYPYSIIYRRDEDEIRVVALAHSRRLSGFWSNRL